MPFIKTPLADLLIFEPQVWEDERGYFFESYNENIFQNAHINTNFVQDNQSKSSRGVLRGLHYQIGEAAQSKLVRVLVGEVLDVVLDIRKDSPTYGQHFSIVLSAENKKQLYVPRGFAHGYLTYSETAVFFYKCDNFYSRSAEGGIYCLDKNLGIDWGFDISKAILSAKDKELPMFGEHIAF